MKKNRHALDGAQQTIQAHLCELEVWGQPAGATVLVDGKPMGKLPSATGWFEEGSVPLEISAPGFVAASKRLRLTEGGRIREHVGLKPAPKAVAASPPEAGLAKRQAAVAAKEGGNADPEASGGDQAPIYRKWWFWTLAGALVLAAGGTTAWIITHRNSDPCAEFGPDCGVF